MAQCLWTPDHYTLIPFQINFSFVIILTSKALHQTLSVAVKISAHSVTQALVRSDLGAVVITVHPTSVSVVKDGAQIPQLEPCIIACLM